MRNFGFEKPLHKLVYIQLCFFNEFKDGARPSKQLLADLCNTSIATLDKSLKFLEQKKLIEVIRRTDKETGAALPNFYKVNYDLPEEFEKRQASKQTWTLRRDTRIEHKKKNRGRHVKKQPYSNLEGGPYSNLEDGPHSKFEGSPGQSLNTSNTDLKQDVNKSNTNYNQEHSLTQGEVERWDFPMEILMPISKNFDSFKSIGLNYKDLKTNYKRHKEKLSLRQMKSALHRIEQYSPSNVESFGAYLHTTFANEQKMQIYEMDIPDADKEILLRGV